MRRLLLFLFAAAGVASAQLLEARIEFQDAGCAPCTESLQRRLERMRGVETVALDLEAGTIAMTFAPDNRVRLIPLRARVTQDGTEILAMEVRARGAVAPEGFTLGSMGETLDISGEKYPPNGRYEVRGRILADENKTLSLRLEINSASSLE